MKNLNLCISAILIGLVVSTPINSNNKPGNPNIYNLNTSHNGPNNNSQKSVDVPDIQGPKLDKKKDASFEGPQPEITFEKLKNAKNSPNEQHSNFEGPLLSFIPETPKDSKSEESKVPMTPGSLPDSNPEKTDSETNHPAVEVSLIVVDLDSDTGPYEPPVEESTVDPEGPTEDLPKDSEKGSKEIEEKPKVSKIGPEEIKGEPKDSESGPKEAKEEPKGLESSPKETKEEPKASEAKAEIASTNSVKKAA